MKWPDKVRRIVEDRGLSYRSVETMAGWPHNTLKKSMRNSSVVGIDKAISLARVLCTQAEWLFDDGRSWEDQPSQQPAEAVREFVLNSLSFMHACVLVGSHGIEEWRDLRIFLYEITDSVRRVDTLTPERLKIIEEAFNHAELHYADLIQLGKPTPRTPGLDRRYLDWIEAGRIDRPTTEPMPTVIIPGDPPE